jgi:predicted RNase H-like HicB family nuclease
MLLSEHPVAWDGAKNRATHEPERSVPINVSRMTYEIQEGKKMKEFSVIIERDEDGYFVASVPSLRGCHTQAKSLDTLMKRIKEAIELCLEVEKPTSNEFIGVQKVAVNA